MAPLLFPAIFYLQPKRRRKKEAEGEKRLIRPAYIQPLTLTTKTITDLFYAFSRTHTLMISDELLPGIVCLFLRQP